MSQTTNPIRESRRRDRRRRVYQAIDDAEDGLTARELRFETMESENTLRTILKTLREQDRIRRYRDPDDGRIYRYETHGGRSE